MRNLIKILLLFSFLFKFGVAAGQGFSYPIINKEEKTVENFIPCGWAIKDSAAGDLNNDGIADFVIVLEYKNSAAIIKEKNDSLQMVTTHPRILIILLRNNLSNELQLADQNNRFILTQDDSLAEDPYQGINIENEILYIHFIVFYGSAYKMLSYAFRFQNKLCALIGADSQYFNPATRESDDCSYNFLTKRWSEIINENNDDPKTRPQKTLHTVGLKGLKTLRSFGEANTWKVTKDNSL